MNVHYHLDGFIAHPGESCNLCEDKQKSYLFNVMTTEVVHATSTEEAYDKLNNNLGEVQDRDVMLVEIGMRDNPDEHLEMDYEDKVTGEY